MQNPVKLWSYLYKCIQLFTLLVFLEGCQLSRYQGYHGDGGFYVQQSASWNCPDHYVVDLGAIDLSTSTQEIYKLSGLPNSKVIIGFEITNPFADKSKFWFSIERPNTAVDLIVTDKKENVVISVNGPLSHSVMEEGSTPDTAFLYFYNTLSKSHLDESNTGARTENTKANKDHNGSIFEARRGEQYTLRLNVEKPDPNVKELHVHLQVKSTFRCLGAE